MYQREAAVNVYESSYDYPMCYLDSRLPPAFLNRGRNQFELSRISETPCANLRLKVSSRPRVTGPRAFSANLQSWLSTSSHPGELLKKRISASPVVSFTLTRIVERLGADLMRGKWCLTIGSTSSQSPIQNSKVRSSGKEIWSTWISSAHSSAKRDAVLVSCEGLNKRREGTFKY